MFRIYTYPQMHMYFLSALLKYSLAVLLCLCLQLRAGQKFTMAVNFAKTEEKRLPTVLSTNSDISCFQIPYLAELLSPYCSCKVENSLHESQQR